MPVRVLGGIGCVLAALAVALSAYAAHGAEGAAQFRLAQAAAFTFAHGLALAALAPGTTRRVGVVALAAMLLGVLLFSGSLYLMVLAGLKLGLVTPVGGVSFLLGWGALALSAFKLAR